MNQSFDEAASERPRGVVREFFAFAWEHKRWWIVPIVVILLIVALLVVLGSVGGAPFIYPLF